MTRPGNPPFAFHGRERELELIADFLDAGGAGFTHLRGRRRVGKSELLRKVQANLARCFYFMGRGDEGHRTTLKRFARDWDRFTGVPRLTRLKLSELHWDELFDEVAREARRDDRPEPVVVLLDEVRWLARRGVGFCGLLKAHWSEWRKTGRIKLLIAGSSNRFFHQYADGEMAILRGLRTHAEIWVEPFTLAETHRYYFPAWTQEEVCLLHMMLGGIPYYLENISPDPNFIRAVNDSVFCRTGIFLDEVDAMLKLETSTVGARQRVKEILGALGHDGATQGSIVACTGMTQDYVHKAIDRLLDYDLVRERRPQGEPKANRAGVRYAMPDPYLNFYFQVLRPMEATIRGNAGRMLFVPEVVTSGAGYSIPSFSGQAFERLIISVLQRAQLDESLRTEGIFEKLRLRTGRYEVGTYWCAGETQIDIVVEGIDDRERRIVEAKWLSHKVHAGDTVLDQVRRKQRPRIERDDRVTRSVVVSRGASSGFLEQAVAQGVEVIELKHLFAR